MLGLRFLSLLALLLRLLHLCDPTHGRVEVLVIEVEMPAPNHDRGRAHDHQHG
jgi:hypothetical protein